LRFRKFRAGWLKGRQQAALTLFHARAYLGAEKPPVVRAATGGRDKRAPEKA